MSMLSDSFGVSIWKVGEGLIHKINPKDSLINILILSNSSIFASIKISVWAFIKDTLYFPMSRNYISLLHPNHILQRISNDPSSGNQ